MSFRNNRYCDSDVHEIILRKNLMNSNWVSIISWRILVFELCFSLSLSLSQCLCFFSPAVYKSYTCVCSFNMRLKEKCSIISFNFFISFFFSLSSLTACRLCFFLFGFGSFFFCFQGRFTVLLLYTISFIFFFFFLLFQHDNK